ncbi:hypothetical protein [Oceanobacillus sp. FSL K6-0127]|uniref:hypothetical protein n=1 Tax=Oceanobacillus sp. FSL K6-0127 TaxID=2921420 RepID=UPI0030EE97B7
MKEILSDINCLVCKHKRFVRCTYSVDYKELDLEMAHYGEFEHRYDTSYVDVEGRSFNDHLPNEFESLYVYACEKCGFIMNFMKQKKVYSSKDIEDLRDKERNRRREENTQTWTFGKEK